MVARYGGEEFIIMLPETGLDYSAELAERLEKTIQEHDFILKDTQKPSKITISLGATELSPEIKDANAFMKAADTAMYKIKRKMKRKAKIKSSPKQK